MSADDSAGETLLERARAGDREALEVLLQRHRAALERRARLRLGQGLRRRVATSDVLQSTYIDILRSIGDFSGRDEEEFANWVVRILENNLRDAARYHAAERRSRRRDSTGHDLSELQLPAEGPTPSAEAVIGDELILIGKALRRLPEDYARIICLHMKPWQDHATTARMMNRSETASRVLLARARSALLLEIRRLRKGDDEG